MVTFQHLMHPSIRLTEVIKKTVYIVGTLILPTSYSHDKKKMEVKIFNLGYFFAMSQ